MHPSRGEDSRDRSGGGSRDATPAPPAGAAPGDAAGDAAGDTSAVGSRDADTAGRSAEFRRLRTAPPIHKTVQDEIRHHIIREGLRPGDPLRPEAELARTFGVSRNSVREAVKALESTGILQTRRGSGVYVQDFSFSTLLENLPYGLMQDQRALGELLELRKALESGMIQSAMGTLTRQNIDALRVVLEQMRERAERGEDFAQQDREFHTLLFVDLGNAMLLQLFDLFWQAYHRAAPAIAGRDRIEVYQLHADIVDAVLSEDPDRARAAIAAHYVGIEERLGSA